VYGPVRTVVWQGSVGDRRPYADLVAQDRAIRLWREIVRVRARQLTDAFRIRLP
jgi:hypothetical protein